MAQQISLHPENMAENPTKAEYARSIANFLTSTPIEVRTTAEWAEIVKALSEYLLSTVAPMMDCLDDLQHDADLDLRLAEMDREIDENLDRGSLTGDL